MWLFLLFVHRDTAGQERFRTITTAYYRGAMGIMLVYDVNNERSFENIKNWIRNIEENASADVEKMLLGNKCDLADRRQVSKERGEQLAIEYGIKFMETSAKASINVEEAFYTLARDIKAKTEKKLVIIHLLVGSIFNIQYSRCFCHSSRLLIVFSLFPMSLYLSLYGAGLILAEGNSTLDLLDPYSNFVLSIRQPFSSICLNKL